MHSRRRLAFSGFANELVDEVLLTAVDALAAAAITEGGSGRAGCGAQVK